MYLENSSLLDMFLFLLDRFKVELTVALAGLYPKVPSDKVSWLICLLKETLCKEKQGSVFIFVILLLLLLSFWRRVPPSIQLSMKSTFFGGSQRFCHGRSQYFVLYCHREAMSGIVSHIINYAFSTNPF